MLLTSNLVRIFIDVFCIVPENVKIVLLVALQIYDCATYPALGLLLSLALTKSELAPKKSPKGQNCWVCRLWGNLQESLGMND